MLAIKTKQSLREMGIEASHSNDFASGLKLMQLVNEVYYNGDNQILANKLKITDQRKTGNNVLNINMIMNHLKKDPHVHLSETVRQLNTFTILQDQQTMILLVEEILSHYRRNNNAAYVRVDGEVEDLSPPKQHDNQFQNLYFVASLDKKNNVLDDSLEEDNPQEKVVKKGSFKVLKPKAHTASKVPSEESERGAFHRTEQKQQAKQGRQPLKEVLAQSNQAVENEAKDDLHCRKTIPKMYEKPPLYRQNVPRPQKSAIKMQPTPQLTTRRPNKEELLKNIESLNRQILEEERSITMNQRETSIQKRSRRSSKKVFKIDIPETDEKKKKILLEWLISINLLNATSIKFMHQLHQICKDGVVFVQIVNYYKGRGKELYYFRQPKRSAQLHSNYQKLFTALSEHVNFDSPLLFQFEYFMPEAQPSAFWHLLACIHHCYNKRVPRESNINRYQNDITRRVDRSQSKKKKTNESTSYKQIKFNSSQKQFKSNSSSVEMPRKETPTPKRVPSRRSQQHSEKELGSFGLVQNQEPSQDLHNRTDRGYKELYLNKFKNIETPHKNRSFSNSSFSKQKSKMVFVSSSRKKEHKPLVPSINLEMQMKVLSYIEDLTTDEDVPELFKDPFRNGVLLCMTVRKYLGIECTVNRRPRNIQDCRNNFYNAIELIKSHKQNFNSAYESYIEDLLKGEKTLLYGLIWQLIKDERENRNNSFSIYNKRGSNQQDATVTWIRSLERCYPPIGEFKIRSQAALLQAITGTSFLFHYSWFITSKKAITPTYENPINCIQRESNLKKVLSYLIQNKIVRSDYLWKTKSLLKNQNQLLKELVNDLISHYNHLYQKEQIRSINFVKFTKRQDSESKEKYKEKLETTMANHSMPQPPPIQREEVKLEVPWMRKLGFTGSLELKNGVILCRLLTKLTMKTIEGFHQLPQSKAQSLGNIRKAIKLVPKFRWDEYDILNSDSRTALEIYSFLRDRYRHSYAMKGL